MRATLVGFALLAVVGCGKREPPAPSTATETGVRVTDIKGRVRVKRADALLWTDASLATTLQKGDLISTDDTSTAKLRFFDGSLFDVRHDSLITILDNFGDPSRPSRVGVGIESGQANFKTSASAGETSIETPNGRATPERDTEGNVQVARGGEAAVHIYRGRSRVEARNGQQLHLGPSESVRIDAEGKAAPAEGHLPLKPPFPIAADQSGTWSGVLRSPQLALDTQE